MSEAEPDREADHIPGTPPPEAVRKVVGHGALAQGLGRQIASGKLPGAWLLHGPKGIGKASLAFALIGALFVQTGDEAPERVAEQIVQGVHPNLFVLRKKRKDARGFYTVIRVQDVRDMRDKLHQTRGRTGYRVCVVDAIDDCNANAANALLKILEEPPPQTLFVLISHRPGGLLPTIRSRCQAHAMRPIPDADMRTLFGGTDGDPALLDQALALAAGRPRRVHEILAAGQTQSLVDLGAWLASPRQAPAGSHLALADALSAAIELEKAMAREMIGNALAGEAEAAARAAPMDGNRLASASALWEKANALFADTDIYNLDLRQTLTTLFDAIYDHHSHAIPIA